MFITSIPQYIQGITNAKVDLTGTTATTLFTVASDADFNVAIVSSILVSNDQGSADTITVTIESGGATFSLFKVEEVGAVSTRELLTRDLVLQSGDVLKVQAATINRLHVVASIQELSKTRVTTSAASRI
jgi:hypothetical protein